MQAKSFIHSIQHHLSIYTIVKAENLVHQIQVRTALKSFFIICTTCFIVYFICHNVKKHKTWKKHKARLMAKKVNVKQHVIHNAISLISFQSHVEKYVCKTFCDIPFSFIVLHLKPTAANLIMINVANQFSTNIEPNNKSSPRIVQ